MRLYSYCICCLQEEMSKITQWIKICEFLRFYRRGGGRLRCSQAKSLLNPSIIFVIKACIFTISISYDTRGSRLFIEWGITDSSDYSKGGRESLRCRWVKFPSNPSILLGIRAYISELCFWHKKRGLIDSPIPQAFTLSFTTIRETSDSPLNK